MAKNFSLGFEIQLQNEKNTIEINGVKYTIAEYKALKKNQERSERKKREKTVIQQLPPYIHQMIKHVRVLKSLAAFYDNGYRQWGCVCREILNNSFFKSDYIRYRAAAREMEELVNQIEKIGKKNEKNVFQYIEKLSYKVDDMKTIINYLVVNIWKSRVCEFYKNEPCINSTGKRLGLRIIITNAISSMNEIEKIVKELESISTTGLDIYSYNIYNGRYSGVNY